MHDDCIDMIDDIILSTTLTLFIRKGSNVKENGIQLSLPVPEHYTSLPTYWYERLHIGVNVSNRNTKEQ